MGHGFHGKLLNSQRVNIDMFYLWGLQLIECHHRTWGKSKSGPQQNATKCSLHVRLPSLLLKDDSIALVLPLLIKPIRREKAWLDLCFDLIWLKNPLCGSMHVKFPVVYPMCSMYGIFTYMTGAFMG